MADEAEKPGEGHNSKNLDFVGAAKLLRGEIATLDDKAAKTRGDQSAAWKKIEEMGLNKKASKAIFSLQNQGSAEVSDYLRTVIGLLNPLGLGIIRDMVDVAENQNAISVPLIDTPSVDV